MKLRRYQEKAIWYATRHLLEVPKVLLVMPTGSGKTVVASTVCKSFEPVLWLAHQTELLGQAGKALEAAGVEHTLLSTSTTQPPSKRYNLVVYDEYHHSPAPSNQNLLEQLSFDRLLGITATPDRLDGKLVQYDRVVRPTGHRSLIQQGYLTRVRLFYVRSHNHWLDDLVNWANKHTGLGKTIFFVKSHKEATRISSRLRLNSAVVKGTPKHRKSIIHEFEHGGIDCLVSCLVLTEGVDLPICKSVILGRKTFSATLLSQMVGRAMRLHHSKPQYCNIIEPASMAPTKRYVSTSSIIEPDYYYVSTPIKGRWDTKRLGHLS